MRARFNRIDLDDLFEIGQGLLRESESLIKPSRLLQESRLQGDDTQRLRKIIDGGRRGRFAPAGDPLPRILLVITR